MTKDEQIKMLKEQRAVLRASNEIFRKGFIDKACEWLDFHLLDYHLGEQQVNKVIEDFRKAMTEKTNPLFEQCLANVNPEIRDEVRRNMEDLL